MEPDTTDAPHGLCECGAALRHYRFENVGGLLCPDCDHEHAEELAVMNEIQRMSVIAERTVDAARALLADTPNLSAPEALLTALRVRESRRDSEAAAVPPCPICAAPGVPSAVYYLPRDLQPVGTLLDATCSQCGWHYTSRELDGATT